MDIQISVDNEQMFVPVHYVTDAFGYKLSENSAEQQYIISKDSQTITFSIGSKQVYVIAEDTNAEVKLEAAPRHAGKYILMPVQFFKVCMCRQVYQDSSAKKVLVVSVSSDGQRIGADTMMSHLEKDEKGDSEIVVAVIDAGVDVHHLYFRNRIVQTCK